MFKECWSNSERTTDGAWMIVAARSESSVLLAMLPFVCLKLYAIQLIIPPTFLAIKLSLLMLYWHVFHPNKAMRYLIWAGIIVNTMVYSAFLGAQILVWSPSTGHPWFATAISAGVPTAIVLSTAQSGFNVLSDFYLFILPFGGLLNLSLSTRQKVGVSAIFMTGAAACASSILTLVYRIKLLNDTDTTWDLGPVYTLSIVETTVGIMCSCMPALAAFFRLHTPLFQSLMSMFSSGFRRSTGGEGSGKGSSTTLSSEGREEVKRPLSRVNWPFRNARSGRNSPLIAVDDRARDRGVEEKRVGG
ncbi:hypothetical protein MMC30_007944 [Trapelia coarctata]|nr:hypothetical protein [Trapelia coarctata]